MLGVRHQYMKENPCSQTAAKYSKTVTWIKYCNTLSAVMGIWPGSEEYRKWAPGKISTA